jgi:hypothetical protein
LREIPDGALRLVIASTSKSSCPGMLVEVLISPLPHVTNHVYYTEWTCTGWMRVHIVWPSQRSSLVRSRNSCRDPFITPRVKATVGGLCCQLPLPLMGKPLTSSLGVSACVFDRDPGDGFVSPTLWVIAILPVMKEIDAVLRLIVCCVRGTF